MAGKMKQGDAWVANVFLKGSCQAKQRPVINVSNELA